MRDVNCGDMPQQTHSQAFSPGVSVPKEHRTILRSSRVWEMMWGSVSWISLCPTISQLVTPWGVPTPRSHPEEYRPSNLPDFHVSHRLWWMWRLLRHLMSSPKAFQGDAPQSGRNKTQGSKRFLPPPLCCSFPWLLCSAPQTNPKIYLLTRDPSDSIQSSLIKNSHYYD